METKKGEKKGGFVSTKRGGIFNFSVKQLDYISCKTVVVLMCKKAMWKEEVMGIGDSGF